LVALLRQQKVTFSSQKLSTSIWASNESCQLLKKSAQYKKAVIHLAFFPNLQLLYEDKVLHNNFSLDFELVYYGSKSQFALH
jgi:hypothetical protein